MVWTAYLHGSLGQLVRRHRMFSAEEKLNKNVLSIGFRSQVILFVRPCLVCSTILITHVSYYLERANSPPMALHQSSSSSILHLDAASRLVAAGAGIGMSCIT